MPLGRRGYSWLRASMARSSGTERPGYAALLIVGALCYVLLLVPILFDVVYWFVGRPARRRVNAPVRGSISSVVAVGAAISKSVSFPMR